MKPAIEYRAVSKCYGEKAVLRDVTLTVDEGEFVTIVGASGGGKTTLLKVTNGLVTPSSGAVLIHGREIPRRELIAQRRCMGYAIQGSVLFPHMTVEQNIAYVPSLLNGRDRARTAAAVRKWMAILGLEEELLPRYPDELSGGQQQRVGIARALAASPDILLMDEPFGAVDEITREQLQGELARIHRQTGITVLFVTHDISEALRLGSRVLVMEGGQVIQYAAPREIRESPATPYVSRLISRQL